MPWFPTILFVLGGAICCLNFYRTFLRFPVHRLRGRRDEDYRWVSGWPLLGSLFVAISLPEFWSTAWLRVPGLILISIDTGGLHWFVGIQLLHPLFGPRGGDRDRGSEEPPD